jgi:hypothetical protein
MDSKLCFTHLQYEDQPEVLLSELQGTTEKQPKYIHAFHSNQSPKESAPMTPLNTHTISPPNADPSPHID